MGCLGFIVYRFNSLFNLPKRRALVVSILCFIAGGLLLLRPSALPAYPGCSSCSA